MADKLTILNLGGVSNENKEVTSSFFAFFDFRSRRLIPTDSKTY